MQMTALIALLALLVLAPAGMARANTIASGETRLKLNDSLVERLRKQGVRMQRLEPSRVKGREIALRIAEGQVDEAGKGSIRHAGGFKFVAGSRAATLRRIFLNTAKNALTATIGSQSLRIASTGPHSAAFDGFDLKIAARDLRVTGRAAQLINRKLGMDGLIRPGQLLGTVFNTTELEWLTVFGGSIELTFDQGFQDKLASIDVTARPFESTKLLGSAPPSFSMDILHGQIVPDLSGGVLITEGGFYLQQGGDPGSPAILVAGLGMALDSKRVSGDLRVLYPSGSGGTSGLASIDLGGASTASDAKVGTIAVLGIKATLDAGTADALNETFAKPKGKAPLFAAGEPFGTVAFTTRTR